MPPSGRRLSSHTAKHGSGIELFPVFAPEAGTSILLTGILPDFGMYPSPGDFVQ